MSMIINDDHVEARLIEERRRQGLDRFDEVWNGVYVMSPLANNEHQRVSGELYAALLSIVGKTGMVYPGANVTDQADDWTQNYRVPDVLVFLNATSAEDRGTHWFGGPDFAIEVVSRGDRTLEKLDFYAKVNTKELLVVDREPWQLTLYRRDKAAMKVCGKSTLDDGNTVASNVIPARFSLQSEDNSIRVDDMTRPTLRSNPIRIS